MRKELLDSLFYQEGDAIPEGKEAGDATPANTTGRQRDLENAAAVLKRCKERPLSHGLCGNPALMAERGRLAAGAAGKTHCGRLYP